MRVEEFDYELPEELIAQTPLENRSDSRLMVVNPLDKSVVHTRFYNLLDFLDPGDLLVFNNSKVIPARIYGKKVGTGANIELLLTKQVAAGEWIAMAKPAKRLKEGSVISFASPDGQAGSSVNSDTAPVPPYATVLEVQEGGLRRLKFTVEGEILDFLHDVGSMPLPPYIQTPLTDPSRYQTVYADPVGSVAAPTAGLHFTEELLEQLRQRGVQTQYVTLHVGLGTFRPVQVDVVEDHVMHTEAYEVRAEVVEAVQRTKSAGKRVIAVGTTALRTLESASEHGTLSQGRGETGIFIYPGYKFKVVDALITNFHLPKSTLMMLISTLMGVEFTKAVYAEAVAQRYRFFSFGDAMFITRRCT